MFTLRRKAALCAAVAVTLVGCAKKSEEASAKYRVPDGFLIENVAPASQTGSLVAFTFDSLGRPVVAKERLFPTILIDGDKNGSFETEKTFTDKVKNLQGMWFDGRTLYAVGQDSADNVTGLYKIEDRNGDDVGDTFERVNAYEKTMGEHGPHDIRRGPDGEPTVMLGNHTGVPADLVDPNSPLQNYNEGQLLGRYMDARGHAAGIMAPGGTVTRLERKTGKYTIIGGGFRNAYNHAWNAEGELFTFDSDMEWDINLPWYRGVRSVHVVPGGDYGWRTGSGKLHAYLMDTLPPMRDLGRGSPVGVEFYEHSVYPKEYRGAYFEADWSRGRILVSKPEKCGATYCVGQEGKEFVHGEPLNVTDLEVGPDGMLYFTTGGRDTEGGLFRIRYAPGVFQRMFNSSSDPKGVQQITRQPQPLSSWGHAALLRAKAERGSAWESELRALAADKSAEATDRVSALLTLQRLGPAPNAELLRPLSTDGNASVRAAAIYVASLHSSERAQAIVLSGLGDKDPFNRRRALEGMLRMAITSAPVEQVYALLSDADRNVRYAARLVLERYPREQWAAKALDEPNAIGATESLYALTRTAKSAADLDPLFEKEIAWLQKSNLSDDELLRYVRLFGLTAIRREGGAPDSVRQQVHAALINRFPAKEEALSRELARTLAYCGQPEAIGKILAAMPKDEENTQLQIHYAYCLREIKKGWTPDQKRQLMNWYPKAAEWRGGQSFTGFINLMFDSSLEFFDPEEKKLAYAKVPMFAPMEIQARANGFKPPAAVMRQKGSKAVSNEEIMEFQMFDPMTLKAKAEKGAKIFEKECSQCHRFGSAGKDFGPDLTTIASRFKKKDLLESVLWPSKTISDQYASIIVETKDGDLINAMLVREESDKLILKTAEQERPIEVPKSAVKARRPSKISIMPEGLLNEYGQGEIADLIAYLLSARSTVSSD